MFDIILGIIIGYIFTKNGFIDLAINFTQEKIKNLKEKENNWNIKNLYKNYL